MASSFPSISQTLAYFESPDPAKLAAEEKARQNALAERLRISTCSGPPNVLSSPYEAEVSQTSRPEVPLRPARKREARETPSIPEAILPPTPQDSTITVSSRHRDSPTSEAEVSSLRKEISGIKDEVQGLKEQLGSRNDEFEALNKRLRDTERKYEEAIIDVRKSREEKQELEDTVERLTRQLDRTGNARNVAMAQLATRQSELVDALERLRASEERRIQQRVETRATEDEIRADTSRRVDDEAARRMTEQRLIEEARREGRREGRRERRGSNVTLVVNERAKSSVAWSLVTGRTTRT
jgi:peptidoglycan hydrolase CwlO-like protein